MKRKFNLKKYDALYSLIKYRYTMKPQTKHSCKHVKIRITFFDLFGGGQKVITDFYLGAAIQEEQKNKTNPHGFLDKLMLENLLN